MIRTEKLHAGDNQIIAWGDDLTEMDEQIEALQTAKREFYAGIRDKHGKITADALKAAQRIRGMEVERREKADQIDVETARILAVLEKPRAARHTRDKSAKPPVKGGGEEKIADAPHDPVTGEIIEEIPADSHIEEVRQPNQVEAGESQPEAAAEHPVGEGSEGGTNGQAAPSAEPVTVASVTGPNQPDDFEIPDFIKRNRDGSFKHPELIEGAGQ